MLSSFLFYAVIAAAFLLYFIHTICLNKTACYTFQGGYIRLTKYM